MRPRRPATREPNLLRPQSQHPKFQAQRRRRVSFMKLGPYGQLHRKQLQQSRPEMYRELQKSGELGRYLRNVDQSADRMKELLLKQLAEKQPYNPVKWENNRELWEASLERIADELVLEDRVLVPDAETQAAMRNGYVD